MKISNLSDLLVKQFDFGSQFPVTRLLISDLIADYRIPKPDCQHADERGPTQARQKLLATRLALGQ